MKTSFSIGGLIKSAWRILKNNLGFIILSGIATAIIEIALNIIQNSSQRGLTTGVHGGFGALIVVLLTTIFVVLVGIIVSIGWTKVMLHLTRSGSAHANDFKTAPAIWVRYIKAYIWYIAYLIAYVFGAVIIFVIMASIGTAAHIGLLSAIGVTLGCIAGLAMGIYFSIRYQFLPYVILDYPDLSPTDMLKKASTLSKGSLVQLLGFAIILGLINLLGLICIVLGLIITIPLTKIAHAGAYQYLKERHEHAHPGHNHESETPAVAAE